MYYEEIVVGIRSIGPLDLLNSLHCNCRSSSPLVHGGLSWAL